MLRYYDDIGLLIPASIDPFTHYRQYDANQLDTIQKITLLRDLGFKVDDIKKVIACWNKTAMQSILLAKKAEIIDQIIQEQAKLARLQIALDELAMPEKRVTYDIKIKTVPDYLVLSVRKVVDNYYAESELWQILHAYLKQSQFKETHQTLYFSICHDEGYKEKEVDLEVCVTLNTPIKGSGDIICRQVKGAPMMASLMVSGPYHLLAPAYQTFGFWLQKDTQLELVEISRQVYYRGPWNNCLPEQYLTEIQMPIRPKKLP